jgi:hypothetical protein
MGRWVNEYMDLPGCVANAGRFWRAHPAKGIEVEQVIAVT